MTVVVTGASGHVGSVLVRALLDRGERVRALVHRDRSGLAGLDIEFVQASLHEPDSLRRAFAGAEVVYHAAGRVSVGNDWPALAETNIAGTRYVVNACLACGVRRLVHFSSIEALAGGAGDTLIDEDRPLVCNDRSEGVPGPWLPPYARSKALGECEVRRGSDQGLDAVILYPTAILGPFDFRPSYVGQALLAFARGRLPAVVRGGFDWVDVRDVVAGALQAAASAPAGARYLLSGHWVSLLDVGRTVAALTGARPPLLALPLGVARAATPLMTAGARLTGRPPVFTRAALFAIASGGKISHARASQDLGYQPRPFSETVAETLAWFGANGRLARS